MEICGLNQWIFCLLDYPSTKCNRNPLPELDKLGIGTSSSYCMFCKQRFCLALVQEKGLRDTLLSRALNCSPLPSSVLAASNLGNGTINTPVKYLLWEQIWQRQALSALMQVLAWQQESKRQGIMRKHHSQGHTGVWLTKKCQLLSEMWLCAASQVGSRESITLQLLVG